MRGLGQLVGHQSRKFSSPDLQGERPERDEVVKTFSGALTRTRDFHEQIVGAGQSWQLSVSTPGRCPPTVLLLGCVPTEAVRKFQNSGWSCCRQLAAMVRDWPAQNSYPAGLENQNQHYCCTRRASMGFPQYRAATRSLMYYDIGSRGNADGSLLSLAKTHSICIVARIEGVVGGCRPLLSSIRCEARDGPTFPRRETGLDQQTALSYSMCDPLPPMMGHF